MTLHVNCPQCKKSVIWDSNNSHRPFCSKRCQMIDLGAWAEEEHKISQPIQQDVVLSEEQLDQLETESLQHHKFFVEPE